MKLTHAACALACLGSAAGAQERALPARALFASVDHAGDTVLGELAVRRSRAARIDSALLRSLEAARDTRLRLALFDDVSFDARASSFDRRGADSFTLTGELLDDPDGWWVLSREGSASRLNLFARSGIFQARSIDGDLVAIQELGSELYPACGCDARHAVHSPPSGAPIGAFRQGDDGSVFDVLVVWTPAARIAAGGGASMRAIVENSIAASNVAYANSQIPSRLRLVHLEELSYSESGNFNMELSRLRNTSDGHMDEVHVLRDTHGADFVALLVEDNAYCGLGYLMSNLSPGFASSAFSVSNYSCSAGNLTFPHELGHNQGCHHDRGNAGSSPLFSYSYGWRWHGLGGSQFRSVMAYAPGMRVPHFSNPSVLYDGVPTGVAIGQSNEAHNAESITSARHTIANWRQSVPLGSTYCSPAVANQSGFPAAITAEGSRSAAANDLALAAEPLPAHVFGYFLTSRAQAQVPAPPGSIGVLCLGSPIGRYAAPGQVRDSGAAGRIELALDLTQTPTPSGFVHAAAGETWHFQCWFRDVAGGAPTSNFSDAISVTLL